MKYPLAEKFRAPQGEGLYTGTPMAFVRLVGCSVGQDVCTACDTDFHAMHPPLGGGLFTAEEIVEWAKPYRHMCVTGGEPLDRDLADLFEVARKTGVKVHIETSGTKRPGWLTNVLYFKEHWLCVSPKPGYLDEMITDADEVKVIIGGLGDGPGWPTVADAVRWADAGKLVYIQPRNQRLTVDKMAMDEVLGVLHEYPQLRLSCQLHKYLGVR